MLVQLKPALLLQSDSTVFQFQVRFPDKRDAVASRLNHSLHDAVHDCFALISAHDHHVFARC